MIVKIFKFEGTWGKIDKIVLRHNHGQIIKDKFSILYKIVNHSKSSISSF